MAIEVFNRYEKKYMLDTDTYEKLNEKLKEYMNSDEHSMDGGFYSICNIYFDTENDELIRTSIEQPVYKEKLRLRSYGTPDMDSPVFLEIKKKYKGIVYKRRILMTLNCAKAYLEEATLPQEETVNPQILNEIEYFRRIHKTIPKTYISYDRRAYFGKDDDSFRITFDTNIETRRQDLFLESGSYGKQLLEPGKWMMEVKFSNSVPVWFSNILSELKIYPISFSKYGMEYKNYLKEKIIKGEKTICLNQYSQLVTQQYQPVHQC